MWHPRDTCEGRGRRILWPGSVLIFFRGGQFMQRGLLGIAIASVLTTSAMAADLAVKAPPMVPPVVYNWTGFYIGGNVGYSWGRSSDTSTLTNTAGTVLLTSADRTNLDGVVG